MKPPQRKPRKCPKAVAAARGQPASGETVDPDSKFMRQRMILSNPFIPRNLQEPALDFENDQLDQCAVEQRQRDAAHNVPAGNFYDFDLGLNPFAEPAANSTPHTMGERLGQSAYQMRQQDEDGTHRAIETGLYDNFDPEYLSLPEMEEADFQQPLNSAQILQYDHQGALAGVDDVQQGVSFGGFGNFIGPQVNLGRMDQVDVPESTNGVQQTVEEGRIVGFQSEINTIPAIDTSSAPSISRSSLNIELPAQSLTAVSIREVTPIGDCPEISNEEFDLLIDELYGPAATDENVADNAEIAIGSSQKASISRPSPNIELPAQSLTAVSIREVTPIGDCPEISNEEFELLIDELYRPAATDENVTDNAEIAIGSSQNVDARSASSADGIGEPMDLVASSDEDPTPKVLRTKSPSPTVAPAIAKPKLKSADERQTYPKKHDMGIRLPQQRSNRYTARVTQGGSTFQQPSPPHLGTTTQSGSATSETYKPYTDTMRKSPYKRFSHGQGRSRFRTKKNFDNSRTPVAPQGNFPPNYSTSNNSSAPSRYSGHPGYSGQAGYASQTGYVPQTGYAPQAGYAPQTGYASQTANVPPTRHASQAAYVPQTRHASQTGFASQTDFASQTGFASQTANVPPTRHAPQTATFPRLNMLPRLPTFPKLATFLRLVTLPRLDTFLRMHLFLRMRTLLRMHTLLRMATLSRTATLLSMATTRRRVTQLSDDTLLRRVDTDLIENTSRFNLRVWPT